MNTLKKTAPDFIKVPVPLKSTTTHLMIIANIFPLQRVNE